MFGQTFDRLQRARRADLGPRAAVPEQQHLDRELHVGERSVAELEVELGGFGRTDALALDPLAHPADLQHAVDRDAVRWIGEVAGGEREPPAQGRVSGDGAGTKQRLELPWLRIALPVLKETGHRSRQRPVAALGP